MRIGLDLHTLLRLPRCGMHHHAYEIIRALVSGFPTDQYLLFVDESALSDPQFDRRWVELESRNYSVVPVPTIGPTVRLARLAWLQWHLPRALARARVDLVHGFSHSLPRRWRCRSVVTVHDLMPERLLSWQAVDDQQAAIRRHLIAAIGRADGICTVSEATRRDVADLSAAPSAVTPNAVRDTLQHVSDRRRLDEVAARYQLPSRFLLTVGADTPRRNYAALVDALAGTSDQQVPPLVVVGSTAWNTTRMAERAIALGVQSRLTCLAGVPDDDLSAIYSLATAYVCPSMFEGFGMPVLEAFACGTRVVCSDLPALREVAGTRAVYFDPEDIESIRRGLVSISERPPGSQAERADLMRHANQYSWAASARTVRDLYDRLLTGAVNNVGDHPNLKVIA
jgi:glycosyltransferase involved in cell wall biosynthesis